jgi:hypothetical protein
MGFFNRFILPVCWGECAESLEQPGISAYTRGAKTASRPSPDCAHLNGYINIGPNPYNLFLQPQRYRTGIVSRDSVPTVK